MSRISVSTNRQFHIVVAPHIYSIRRYAASLTRNRADADDLLQDTLLRAFLKLHLWRPDTSMRGWLTVIMRRIFLTQYARAGRSTSEFIPLDDCNLGVESSQDLVLELRELEARWPALSSDHREVLERIAIAGDSYDEVSKRLHLPLGTLRARLHRARKALRPICP
ncbi:MAG: RNA polymerase sigma factor [Inquilinus sp.]|uniref:RNA polymerase sigma factor n=1 Tax=Inquilinus sp. TaxID=1932117 RepID=UPI003F2A49C3